MSHFLGNAEGWTPVLIELVILVYTVMRTGIDSLWVTYEGHKFNVSFDTTVNIVARYNQQQRKVANIRRLPVRVEILKGDEDEDGVVLHWGDTTRETLTWNSKEEKTRATHVEHLETGCGWHWCCEIWRTWHIRQGSVVNYHWWSMLLEKLRA